MTRSLPLRLRGGVVAGFIAGLILFTLMAILAATRGQDVWMGMKGAAAPFLGARAMQPGFDGPAVVAGALCHFAVSIGWGIPFSLLVYGMSRIATVVLGAAWGLVVWIGMYYVVLPIIGMGDVARQVPLAVAISSHVFFGLLLGFALLPFQRPRRAGDLLGRRAPVAP